MRRVALSLAALGLLALGVSTAAAAPEDHVSLAPASAKPFPDRSFRLTVPERRRLRAEDVKITENGEPVSGLSLATADGARTGTFGTVVVIDASSSMRGAAIRSAIGAARELARQRSDGQQLGFVLFNNTPKVLLAPTDDQRAIDAALSTTPTLAPQTYIFDAVSLALDELEKASITAGSVVVLSDGSDTGSQAALDAVAKRARAANVAIYSVGLRSRSFNQSGLKVLATTSRGRYIAAVSVADARPIFRQLGAQLASDYLLNYRSFARPGREVTVAVRVAGVPGLATSSYRVPGDATFVQVEPGFWTSDLGVAVTGLLCALLLGLGLALLLVRRGRGPTLRERVQGFVSLPGDEASPAADAVLTGRAPGGAERSLEKTQWWVAFKRDVEIACITIEPIRIVTASAVATLVLMYLLVKSSGIPLVGLFALAIPWSVRTWVRVKRDRRRALFAEQLPDMLQGAASAIRAGHGLVSALSMMAEDAPEPSRSEFRRVVADEGIGVPLDEALRVVEQRMASREVLQIALVAQIQREAGGNMAEVLDRITESLRQSAELRRMVKSLTAQGRLSRWVVTALPLTLLLFMSIVNPTYVGPLYTTSMGLIMLALAGAMMAMGSVVIGKIVNFKV